MSRENKLALIIGFGLVLFVGVLISDHLSEANRQVTADLTVVINPLEETGNDGPSIVEFGTPPPPAIATSTPTHATAPTTVPAAQPASAHVPIPVPLATSVPGPTLHVVAEGETLTSICRQWYDDEGLASVLASWNNLPNPDRLVPGTRLVMPDTASLVPGYQPLQEPVTVVTVSAAPPAAREGVYTVQPGDTLSQIAQKLLGTSRATAQLYDLNRLVIGDVDALQVGMQLRYPLASN